MNDCGKGVSGNITQYYSDSFGIDDFFLYVSCNVTVEQALSSIAILTPKFFELEGCIFWENSQTRNIRKKLNNICLDKENTEEKSEIKKRNERYYNIFAIDNFFQKWTLFSNLSISENEKNRRNVKVLLEFAKQIEKYWRLALMDCYPDKTFEFQISENGIFDEKSVCLTFWQKI
ncbi:MAG: hypothetical protein ABF802_04880 [Acetobacter orientalis]|uniref:hypothetical protein n=1 Tax=Acetobacter orientalis TaxID=146474 RepID=UPI0039E75FA7